MQIADLFSNVRDKDERIISERTNTLLGLVSELVIFLLTRTWSTVWIIRECTCAAQFCVGKEIGWGALWLSLMHDHSSRAGLEDSRA